MQWKTIRRETGLIEHVCPHGVGHPNYASAKRMARLHNETNEIYEAWLSHGCDGCCSSLSFPGKGIINLKYAFNLYLKHDLLDHVESIDENLYLPLSDLVVANKTERLDEIVDIIASYDNDMIKKWQIECEFLWWPLVTLGDHDDFGYTGKT